MGRAICDFFERNYEVIDIFEQEQLKQQKIIEGKRIFKEELLKVMPSFDPTDDGYEDAGMAFSLVITLISEAYVFSMDFL